MYVTWMGTNTILLESDTEKILIDPFAELAGAENPLSVQELLETGADCILITHGHFDHLLSVPEMLEKGDVTVFCASIPARTLEGMTEEGRIVLLRPGTRCSLGHLSVRTLRGKHICFDTKLIVRTILPKRLVKYWKNLCFMLRWMPYFPEGKQTLVYELRAEGKTIQILGSCGLAAGENYTEGADLLILPYQGSSRLEEKAEAILRKLRPKKVMLSHFDDAFPPVSSHVDTRKLCRLMKGRFAHIPVIKPTAGKRVRI